MISQEQQIQQLLVLQQLAFWILTFKLVFKVLLSPFRLLIFLFFLVRLWHYINYITGNYWFHRSLCLMLRFTKTFAFADIAKVVILNVFLAQVIQILIDLKIILICVVSVIFCLILITWDVVGSIIESTVLIVEVTIFCLIEPVSPRIEVSLSIFGMIEFIIIQVPFWI